MASAFGHAAFSFALGRFRAPKNRNIKFWFWMLICSLFPDIDVLAFRMGIPYANDLGHRGFTHSILFALIFGFIVSFLFFSEQKRFSSNWWKHCFLLFLSTLSHGILDAFTNGGLGVGFLIPFSSERFFFPLHPIKVSPISVDRFLTHRGWEILMSEFIWIGGACSTLVTLERLRDKVFQSKK